MTVTDQETLLIFESVAKLGNTLSICPPFDFTSLQLEQNQYSKLRAWIIFSVLLLLNLINFYCCSAADDTDIYVFVRITVFWSATMTLEPIIGGLLKRHIWQELFRSFMISAELKSDYEGVAYYLQKNLNLCCLCCILVSIVLPCYGYITWIIRAEMNLKNAFLTSLCMIADTLSTVHSNSQKFIMCSLLLELRSRYKSLNNYVKSMLKSTLDKNKLLQKIAKLELRILRLHNITESAKKLFETQLFLMIAYGFFVGIEYCRFTYNYFEIELIPMYLLFIIPVFISIYSCDITYDSAKKLSSNLLSCSKLFENDEDIYEKVKDLSLKILKMETKFTAARFLIIDRKIALSLISAVAAYFLVVQQTFLPRYNFV